MRRLARRGFSYVFLAMAIIGARIHIIAAWMLRQFLKLCKWANCLHEWNIEQWRRGMLYNLTRFGKYQGIDVSDDNGENDTD